MISKDEANVLDWYSDVDEFWCANYSILCRHTRLTKADLKPTIEGLKEKGYLAYESGLVDDEGIPAGSGWYRTRAGADAYYEYLEDLTPKEQARRDEV